MRCDCPKPAALTAIPAATCTLAFDQLVRAGLQRRQASAPFNATAGSEITTEAKWDTLVSAADATKIVLTPFFDGLVIPSSEEQTQGGNDNSTFGGIPEYLGEGFVRVEGVFKNLDAAQKRALKKLTCESDAALGVSNLTMFLFNRFNEVVCLEETPDNYVGVPVYNFSLGTVGSQGLNSKNLTPFRFYLPGDWDDYVVQKDPGFKILTAI